MLHLVQFTKNSFAPINRIPPELFSLIPQCWDRSFRDKNLIVMTHVCRGWRDTLTRCSLLWTSLNCVDSNKTRVYIERSRSSPLEVSLYEYKIPCYNMGAFLRVVPHIDRVDSLTIEGGGFALQNLATYFSRPIPLLKDLTIYIQCRSPPTLSAKLFNGDLSSLCKLTLAGVTLHIPWQNLPNLTAFTLHHVGEGEISVTRLLDFFSNAPLLNKIELSAIPETSDASLGRVVSLPSLKTFVIFADSMYSSILLNHLCIPAGALLHVKFDFPGEDPQLQEVLPKSSENLRNTLHITSAYLEFSPDRCSVRLNGPSGELCMCGLQPNWSVPPLVVPQRRFLLSLDYFDLSRVQRLVVTAYEYPGLEEIDASSLHHILQITKGLRTLLLNQCNNLPFIFALDPSKNTSKHVLCSKLKNLVVYNDYQEPFNIPDLVNMAKERASNGAKLYSITLVIRGELLYEEDVLKLKEHVVHVECRPWESEPEWDSIPDGGGD